MSKHAQNSTTHGQTVIKLTLDLMRNNGYGWSKAMAIAADSVKAAQEQGKTK